MIAGKQMLKYLDKLIILEKKVINSLRRGLSHMYIIMGHMERRYRHK